MNITNALGYFGFFALPQENPQVSSLQPDDKALHDKIVKDLLSFYSKEQVNHPHPGLTSDSCDQQCAIIFRQTKSWKSVESMFKGIPNNSPEIKKWKETWLRRILTIREFQKNIFNATQQIQKGISTPENRVRILAAKSAIKKQLTAGKNDLKALDAKISTDASCFKVIEFICNYWRHLNVFCDWTEVSLDEEEIAVRVQIPDKEELTEKGCSLDKLVNSSTKAIFLIKQSAQEETSFEYEGVEPGKLIRTTRIAVEKKHFASETASPMKRSSSVAEISEAYIFNTDFAQMKESDVKKKVQETGKTARKLERVVKRALNSVNSQLANGLKAKVESKDSANPLWLIVNLSLQQVSQLFSGPEKTTGKSNNPQTRNH